jgi:lactate oxidase
MSAGEGLARRQVLSGGLATLAAGALTPAASASDALAPPYVAGTSEAPIALINLLELEARAEKLIPPAAFAFIARGAGDEWTLRENRLAFDRRAILPRVYRDLTAPDTSTTLLGARLGVPFISPPTMGHGLAHRSAESGTTRGVHAAGGQFVLSTLSNHSIEQVAAASQGPRWFQLYQQQDDGITRELLQRAKAAGYTAIVHTVDVTVGGNRESNQRTGFRWPADLPLANLASAKGINRPKVGLGWRDLDFIQKESGLPVIPKGILHPDDAREALKRGAAGLWLSNHGGRQLDGAPSAFTVLREIAQANGGQAPIIIDGGVRRGQDVFKAIADGASAVALGRPTIYGLTLGGAAGVQATYAKLAEELRIVMQLSGARDLDAIRRATLI